MNAPVRTEPGSHFDDYPVGAVFTGGPIVVSEEEILDFAGRYDPQPMHVDKAAAEQGPYDGLIASGWHTGALMMQLLAKHFVPNPGTLASPGLDELRWLKPVRPGDRLHVRRTTLHARASRSRPTIGIIDFQFDVINQSGETALMLRSASFIRRRVSG
jgi:acyl dehydratase